MPGTVLESQHPLCNLILLRTPWYRYYYPRFENEGTKVRVLHSGLSDFKALSRLLPHVSPHEYSNIQGCRMAAASGVEWPSCGAGFLVRCWVCINWQSK